LASLPNFVPTASNTALDYSSGTLPTSKTGLPLTLYFLEINADHISGIEKDSSRRFSDFCVFTWFALPARLKRREPPSKPCRPRPAHCLRNAEQTTLVHD
jgi:hypothetical protein